MKLLGSDPLEKKTALLSVDYAGRSAERSFDAFALPFRAMGVTHLSKRLSRVRRREASPSPACGRGWPREAGSGEGRWAWPQTLPYSVAAPALIRPSLTRGPPSPTPWEKGGAPRFAGSRERCVHAVGHEGESDPSRGFVNRLQVLRELQFPLTRRPGRGFRAIGKNSEPLTIY